MTWQCHSCKRSSNEPASWTRSYASIWNPRPIRSAHWSCTTSCGKPDSTTWASCFRPTCTGRPRMSLAGAVGGKHKGHLGCNRGPPAELTLVAKVSGCLLGFEKLAFAAALLDQPLRRATAAWAFVEPVVVFVAAGDHF